MGAVIMGGLSESEVMRLERQQYRVSDAPEREKALANGAEPDGVLAEAAVMN